jgi:hypothetical protein
MQRLISANELCDRQLCKIESLRDDDSMTEDGLYPSIDN